MIKRLAQMISLVFDPRIEIPLMIILAMIEAFRDGAAWPFLTMLLFLDAVLPMIFYWHLRSTGEISDADISKRKERIRLYAFTVVCHLGGLGLTWLLGQTALLQILIAFWWLAVMFTLVTCFWKVSLHAGVNSALATYLWVISEGRSVWIFGLVFLVGWSRIKLRKHGVAQVLAGGLLGSLGMLAGIKYLVSRI